MPMDPVGLVAEVVVVVVVGEAMVDWGLDPKKA